MGFKTLGLFLLSGILFLSCSDVPSREKFPGGAGRTTESQRAETQKAVLGGFDPMNPQLPSSGQQAKNEASKGNKISGVIELQKGAKLPANYYLFISLRPLQGGPPLAAKKLGKESFPYQFEITSADRIAMGGDRPFEGEVDVTARIDQDGNPLSREDGDFAGNIKAKIPQSNIRILLEPAL